MKASGLLGRRQPRPHCRRGRKKADTGMVRQPEVSHSTAACAEPSRACAPSFPRIVVPYCIAVKYVLVNPVRCSVSCLDPRIRYVMSESSYDHDVGCLWRPFTVTHTPCRVSLDPLLALFSRLHVLAIFYTCDLSHRR